MGSHKKKSTSKSILSKVGSSVGGGGNKKRGETEDVEINEDEHPYGLGSVVVVNLEGEEQKLANVLERSQVATEDKEPNPAFR